MIEWKVETRKLSELTAYDKNPRRFTDKGMRDLAASVERFGLAEPIVVNRDNEIIGGHARAQTLKKLKGKAFVVQVYVPDRLLTPEEVAELCVRLNKNHGGEFDFDILANEFSADDLIDWGFAPAELGLGPESEKGAGGALAAAFLAPPFSVLNARDGWWQERKRQWLRLGIDSGAGRAERLLEMSGTIARVKASAEKQGTSVFDPVLCELAYLWFSPPGGVVLDPFAGGSVRGIVASKLGRAYVGIDLRREQVEANRIQAEKSCAESPPVWHCGDSRHLARHGVEADFIFSCPPYADLEKYSDDPLDLSAMEYPEFLAAYREIIAAACGSLRDDRFACFVVGEIRCPKGFYRNFVGDTVAAFLAAGLKLYNEAILVTQAGSLPIRAGKQFSASRKLGKTHQNVLVFVKGCPKRATAALGPVAVSEELFPEPVASD